MSPLAHQQLLMGSGVSSYLTSNMYPIYGTDSIGVSTTIVSGTITKVAENYTAPSDGVTIGTQVIAGQLRNTVQQYANWPPDKASIATQIVSGQLRSIVQQAVQKPEDIALTTAVVAGTLTRLVDVYSNWPAERITLSTQIISGVLQ